MKDDLKSKQGYNDVIVNSEDLSPFCMIFFLNLVFNDGPKGTHQQPIVRFSLIIALSSWS